MLFRSSASLADRMYTCVVRVCSIVCGLNVVACAVIFGIDAEFALHNTAYCTCSSLSIIVVTPTRIGAIN